MVITEFIQKNMRYTDTSSVIRWHIFLASIIISLLINGCVVGTKKPDAVAHYPKASEDADIVFNLESNIQKTTFYVDGKKMGTGRRIKVRINNGPHTVIAAPEGYSYKEEFIQPPYYPNSPLSFTFLLGDRGQQQTVTQFGSGENMVPDVAAEDTTLSRIASGGKEQYPENDSVIDATPINVDGISFGNYYALVIGNNAYQNIQPLRTAVNDAKVVANLLEKKYGFQVKLLLNATRADIIKTLTNYRRLSADDNFLIYYAGHGWLDDAANEGYWLPIDAGRRDPSNWVSNASITSTLKAMEAKHIMVIADSCYSGKLTRGLVRMEIPQRNYWQRLAEKKSRTVLASGGLEPVMDSSGKGDGHSVFASAFVDTMQNNQTIMDGSALFNRIRRSVILASDQTPEYADIRKAGHDGGDFLFVPVNK